MALFTKTVFGNPYIQAGTDHDICRQCYEEYREEHPDLYDYQIEQNLQGKLSGAKVFKLFKNSNVPFVLCSRHLRAAADELDTETEE